MVRQKRSRLGPQRPKLRRKFYKIQINIFIMIAFSNVSNSKSIKNFLNCSKILNPSLSNFRFKLPVI